MSVGADFVSAPEKFSEFLHFSKNLLTDIDEGPLKKSEKEVCYEANGKRPSDH